VSSRQTEQNDRFIWATRGRTWGFRFLRTGGYKDPLNEYERAFFEIGDQPEGWCRLAEEVVALRFLDPQERQDAAGRVIPHDFVLLGSWADGISSLDDGRRLIWPQVADEFEEVWNLPDPPYAG
jgi:hypothetical protein